MSDRIVLVVELAIGDRVSEIDTPTGPWYEVVRLEWPWLTIDARSHSEDPPLAVIIEVTEDSAVRRLA